MRIIEQEELDARVGAWPLKSDSLVWVAGGFYGDQVKFFAERYGCFITAFEPQPECAQALRAIPYPKLRVIEAGLGDKDGNFEMCKLGTDACSYITRDSTQVVQGPYFKTRMWDVKRFMREEKIERVDFFLMNMEGYELYLLPYLMGQRLIGRFERLQVQFHLGWDGVRFYQPILDGMARMHENLWQFRPPAWVYWEKKNVA